MAWRCLLLSGAVSVLGCREIAQIDEFSFPYETCVPGLAPRQCYPGAPGTEGVGACKAGTEACNADGTGYESCTAVVPLSFDGCAVPGESDPRLDANCDGQVTPCTHAVEWVRFFGQGDPQALGSTVGDDTTLRLVGLYDEGAVVAGLPVPDANPGGMTYSIPASLMISLRANGEVAGVHGQIGSAVGEPQPNARVLVDVAAGTTDVFAVGLEPVSDYSSDALGRLFVQKFDGATGAPTLEVTRIGDSGANYRRPRIATRVAGGSAELWLASNFSGEADLDGTDLGQPALSSVGGDDIILARLGADGAPIWSKAFGDPSHQTVRSLATVPVHGGAWIAGCLDGTLDLGSPCQPIALGTERRYFTAGFDGDGNCIHAERLGVAASNPGCRIEVAVSARQGEEPVAVAVYTPDDQAMDRALHLVECAGAACTDVRLLSVVLGAGSPYLGVVGAETDAFADLIVAFEYNGLLQVVTAEETFTSDRANRDLAVVKLRREGPAQWRVLWVEALAQGIDTALISSASAMAVAPTGHIVLTGTGRGPLGNVPGPDAVPTSDTLFVARIAP